MASGSADQSIIIWKVNPNLSDVAWEAAAILKVEPSLSCHEWLT